jgi:small-conductance mechanosensitive channel
MPEAGQWWSLWGPRFVWTATTLAGAWAIGHAVAALVLSRLPHGRHGDGTDALPSIARLLRTRLPLWALLAGAALALTYWPLPPRAYAVGSQAIFLLAVLSVTLTAASIASGLVSTHGARWAPGLPVSSLTRNIAWGAVALMGLLVALNGLGVSITPMLTALGVGGLAVALALQEPLANFFAGLFITLAGQIRVGDYVRLDSGQEGYVADFGWRSTRLRMLANNLVIVPNAKLAQALVVNHHLPSRDLAVLVEVGVDYASDLDRVERVVTDVAHDVMATVPGGIAEFAPFVRFHTFNESSIDFTVILRAQEYVDQYLVKHEFIKRLHRRFGEEGIVIPFPIRTLVGREESHASVNGSAVVSQWRGDDDVDGRRGGP